MRYGFEALLTNEFRTLNGTCAGLIPEGPGYESVSLLNQVCGTVGAEAGEATVDGNKFVKLAFNYSYSNIWVVSQRLPFPDGYPLKGAS